MRIAAYSPDEAGEIARGYRTLIEGLAGLHESFAAELARAQALVQAEVGDLSFSKVLVVAEVVRGINKDERQPISSNSFILSDSLGASLRIAYSVGLAAAPFVLRSKQSFLQRYFGKKPPRLSQAAKEATLRVAAAHASSKNRANVPSLAPPSRPIGQPARTALLGRR